MNLLGSSLIAGHWQANGDATFQAHNPQQNTIIEQKYHNCSQAQITAAAHGASQALSSYSALCAEQKAKFLDTIAAEILALGDDLIKLTQAETGLPEARLQGERMRTVNQLKMFADIIRRDHGTEIVDLADPDRAPLPKPETRLRTIALGPVAVFGASNFPYAFSTAGGDTAAALAAGCPVVVKGHPAHPGTAELTARAIHAAIMKCDLHPGVFSLLQSNQAGTSISLIQQKEIQAVGFTGSLHVGKVLQSACNKRSQPIPFYGELGSINPQIVLPNLAQQDPASIAQGLVDSLVLGNGQFCTNPGLWLVPEASDEFMQTAISAVIASATTALLTPGISASYQKSCDALAGNSDSELIATGQQQQAHFSPAKLFTASADSFLCQDPLHQEVFGPAALIVRYKDSTQLLQLIDALEGQLTASIHGQESDLKNSQTVVQHISRKVGRLMFNQMPTGVEVCASMNHGGPYPAATDSRSTSVGSEAYKRFLRPICYQNMPSYLLQS